MHEKKTRKKKFSLNTYWNGIERIHFRCARDGGRNECLQLAGWCIFNDREILSYTHSHTSNFHLMNFVRFDVFKYTHLNVYKRARVSIKQSQRIHNHWKANQFIIIYLHNWTLERRTKKLQIFDWKSSISRFKLFFCGTPSREKQSSNWIFSLNHFNFFYLGEEEKDVKKVLCEWTVTLLLQLNNFPLLPSCCFFVHTYARLQYIHYVTKYICVGCIHIYQTKYDK